MAKFLKLPSELKQWKINSKSNNKIGYDIFGISKKEADGSVTNANLEYIVFDGEDYSSDNVDFLQEEAGFIKSISKISGVSNYIDAVVVNEPTKTKAELYIITDNSKPLSATLNSAQFSEKDVVEFGIRVSEILEKLEANNIYHGNLSPDTIFVGEDGGIKLGGFTEFEYDFDSKAFLAPEINKNGNVDFTTDIYSLGLIMYYMSNNGKLPFENGDTDVESAAKIRLDGKAVSAPANGGEKLKSVIVIACQPDNKNRWKNAGNVKNALTSIRAELPDDSKQNENIIIPPTTDFDGNVFEEFEYDEFEPEQSDEPTEEAEAEESAEIEQSPSVEPESEAEPAKEADNAENSDEPMTMEYEGPAEATEDSADADDNFDVVESDDRQVVDEPNNSDEIDNRVFDDYEPTNVVSFRQHAEAKDYGNFFDDDEPEQENESTEVSATEAQKAEPKPDSDIDTQKDYDVFSDDEFDNESEEYSEEKTKKRRGGLIALIVAIVIILALLGAGGYFAFTNHWFGLGAGSQDESTADTAVATTQAQTTQPTTVAPTTVQPTTAEPTEKYVTAVVGYGYSYAKELLEADGFVVEIGEYRYSEYFDEGYVIAQSPLDSQMAEVGSVVTLDISSGLIEPETEAPTSSQSQSSESESSYSGSTYSGNTSYMSQSEVSEMSREELNIALNEIYARRGRIFDDPSLAAYFNSQSWYTPKYTASEFSKNVVFNEYEQANLQLLVNEQQKRGYR